MAGRFQPEQLPTADQIRRAIELYLSKAYDGPPPPSVQQLLPPERFETAAYLMSDSAERTPDTDNIQKVRSFALRLGNHMYRHMKLRISRPPRERVYVFTVDSHDEFLKAPPGSPDHRALEELKQHNGKVTAAVAAAWDAAKLPTERSFLRQKIRQAKQKKITNTQPRPGKDARP